MTDQKIIDKLFKSYNLAIQNEFENSMHTVRNPEDYSQLMEKARLEWEKKDFEGKKPVDIFDKIDSELLIDTFINAALTCDEFIPESLALKIVKDADINDICMLAKEGTSVEVRIAAITLLGFSKDPSYCEVLINLLYDKGEYAEIIAEKARKALVDIGNSGAGFIEKKINGIEKYNGSDFHLLIALMEIDKDRKSEKVYSILKNGFRNTEEKALAARCLSDYGDGRAVTLLRSFLEKNPDNHDKDTILEVQGAILNLGGSIDGL